MKKKELLKRLNSLKRILKLYKVEINHWAYDNINDELTAIIKDIK